MRSTFGGLEIGKRGLNVHQTALNQTGHNIANADNPHYARQRVTMESMTPIDSPGLTKGAGPGQLGQGVRIQEITRIRDSFYDDQIIHAENGKNQWEVAQNYLYQMEKIFNEPADGTLRSLADNFWSAWQEAANYPDDLSHREVVLERGTALTNRINDIHSKLHSLRMRADNELVSDTDRVNSLAGVIRDLNVDIMKIQALGDRPNDLMDRRDAALEELSKYVNVTVGRGDKDELFVFIGEQALVQGQVLRQLKLTPDSANEGFHRLSWEHTDKPVALNGGRIFSLLDMRDRAVTERIDQNSLFAVNIADTVNEIHQDGFGLNGRTNEKFFSVKNLSSSPSGEFDLNMDGIPDTTAVFRVTGINTVDPEKRIGIEGVITLQKNDRESTPVYISYRPDDTVNDVIRRINDSKAGAVAYLNHENQIALKAVNADDNRFTNFMIRHIEDSGEFLTGFGGVLAGRGAAGAFDYRRTGELSKFASPWEKITLTPLFNPAGQIQVADSVKNNPATVALARGTDQGGTGDYNTMNGKGDGTNALLIAEALKQGRSMIGHSVNAEEFYNSLISKLGTESRTAEDTLAQRKDDLAALNNLRQSVMGVNIDEEMSNMVQFQHSYNAAARVVRLMDEMLDVIVNRLKV